MTTVQVMVSGKKDVDSVLCEVNAAGRTTLVPGQIHDFIIGVDMGVVHYLTIQPREKARVIIIPRKGNVEVEQKKKVKRVKSGDSYKIPAGRAVVRVPA